MTIQRLENIGIVVEDLDATVAFFVELGLEVVGEAQVEGDWVDRCVGLEGVRCDITMLGTPDGQGHLEVMHFHSPTAQPSDKNAPPNTLGIRRIAFKVADLDATVENLRAKGTEFLGDVVQFEESYRLCYIRGPEGIILMLAEQLGSTN